MGVIFDEFQSELLEWKTRWAASPRKEMIHLFLLALEREEIVAVGYREVAIQRRLAAMPISEDVRELVRHALIWAWKDEEMHAIYIRGAILRIADTRLKVTAYLHQLAGGIGGWSSSVLMHARWSDAPFSRALANVIKSAGAISGNVSASLQAALEYGSFLRFCEFNVDAEKTAGLCWQRIAELAAGDPAISPRLISEFRRIETDEERHARIFELFAATFDDEDRLIVGKDARTLTTALAAIGDEFLPRHLRRQVSAENLSAAMPRSLSFRASQQLRSSTSSAVSSIKRDSSKRSTPVRPDWGRVVPRWSSGSSRRSCSGITGKTSPSSAILNCSRSSLAFLSRTDAAKYG